MEDPLFTAQGRYLYVMTWLEWSLRIRVDQLHERSGALLGECLIESIHPSNPGHWMLTRLNLTNVKSRSDMARALKTREGAEEFPWDEILELVCSLVLRAYRTGDPVINAATAPKPQPPGFLLKPFVLHREVSMIFGDGDSGKSLFAQYLALMCSSGHHDLRTGLQSDHPVNTLYLDFERSQEDFLMRLHGLAAGCAQPVPSVFYRRCYRRLCADANEIHRLISDLGIGLLIIDSVGAACGGEIQYAEPVFAYFSALRSLNVSALHVHHITHQERKNDHAKSPYGSVYLRNYSTSTWEFRRLEEEDGMTIGLFHDKHNTTERLPPSAYRVSFDGQAERIGLERTEVNHIAQWAKRTKLSDRIVSVLRRDGPLTVTDLALRLQVETQVISTAIRRERQESPPRFDKADEKKGTSVMLCDGEVSNVSGSVEV